MGYPTGTTRRSRRSTAPARSYSCAGLASGGRIVVGLDDARDQFVPYDIVLGECHVANALDIRKQPDCLRESWDLSRRQIGLARIAGHDHAAVLAKTRQKHLHLHRRGILRLV